MPSFMRGSARGCSRVCSIWILATLATACAPSSAPQPAEAVEPPATHEGKGTRDAPITTPEDDADAAGLDAALDRDDAASRRARPAGDGPRLYVPEGMVKIHEKPDRESPVLGGVRAGQSVAMRQDVERTALHGMKRLYKCDDGWYPVEPRGWVCVGGEGHATKDADDPSYRAAASVMPDVTSDYPFHFGVSIGAPQYRRIPTEAEQQQAEPGLDKHLANLPAADETKGGGIDTTPAGRPAADVFLKHLAHAKPELLDDKEAFEGMKVSWSQELDANGRTWLLTPQLTLIPKDKVRVKPLPTLRGVDLKAGRVELPLVFLWLDDVQKFRRGPDGELVRTDESWKRHEFVAATLNQAKGPGGIYWEMRNGDYIKYQDVTMIRPWQRPKGVGPKDKWMEVRVTWGYLLAYEGDKPVYAAAVSPGIDGMNPHAHATARGHHYIDWKMLSSDMDGNDKGKYWFVDEVPWAAYYYENFAVHGAWWHDNFGRPMSHGCINVAPADARRLFHWMDPVIPEGWYAASAHYPYSKGTTVYIRH